MHLLRMLLGGGEPRFRHDARRANRSLRSALSRALRRRSVAGMAKERLKSPRARLFVALDLPDDGARRDRGVGRGGARRSRPCGRCRAESLHVTLAFLGYRPEKEIERIAEVVERERRAGPAGRAARPGAAPARGAGRASSRCRSLSPGTEALQAELEERLVAERLYEPEKRPFWPHLTVARVRPEGRGSRRPTAVSRGRRDRCRRSSRSPFYGVRIALYRSELQPSGARYIPLAQVELPGAGRQ